MPERLPGSLGTQFGIGPWTVHADACCICDGRQRVHIRPLLVDLLTHLARHAGEVVAREDLLEQVWQHRFVGDSSLSKAVAELRQALGDVERPVKYIETVSKRGYRLVAPVWPCPSSVRPRVAVLPFDRLAGNDGDDQLTDGLAEAVITALSRVPGISVISRQTVRHLKGTDRALSDIASELHVGAFVTGSLVRDGARATLSVELTVVDPEERVVWGETYEDDSWAMLATHRQVAENIAGRVRAALQPGAPDYAGTFARVNPEAHLALVSARRLMGTWTRDALEAGIRHLGEAIEVDPSYAPAHEAMATCLAALGFWGHAPAADAYARARESASIALSLDRSLSHGHVALAFARWLHDWDFDAGEEEFLRAIALNPSDELARMSYALFLLTVRGDRVLAVEQAEAACAVDPLSESTGSMAAWIYLLAGAHEVPVRGQTPRPRATPTRRTRGTCRVGSPAPRTTGPRRWSASRGPANWLPTRCRWRSSDTRWAGRSGWNRRRPRSTS